MSPLAKYVAELSVNNRPWWLGNKYDKMLAPFPNDVKCFELSQVSELADVLAAQAQASGNIAEARAFLPAPVTWIEHRGTYQGGSMVSAYLLVQRDAASASCVSIVGMDIKGGTAVVPLPLAPLPLLGTSDPDGWAIESTLAQQALFSDNPLKVDMTGRSFADRTVKYDGSHTDWSQQLADEQSRAYWLYSALSLINSPNIIHKTEHKASAKLGKRLAGRDQKPFQLLPWHEIHLDVTTEREDGNGGERLTGPKALHFCRQYIRIRLGKLERVRAHWRGDPSLGIAQGTYKVLQG